MNTTVSSHAKQVVVTHTLTSIGPFTWSQTFPACAGLHQSPINLEYFNIVNRKFPSFLFSPNFDSYLLFNLKNNGHTVVGELIAPTLPSSIPQLVGGGLQGVFQFTNFHLHWLVPKYKLFKGQSI
jgi:carbonic anhydrase